MCDPVSLAIMGAKTFGAIQDAKSVTSNVKQKVAIAGEILANAKDEMAQLSKAQDRGLGRMKAAYGKQGVEFTGTAKRLEAAQIEQNERDLLAIKWNADLAANQKINEAKDIKKAGIKKFSNDLFGAVGGQKGIESGFNDLTSFLGLGK